MMGLCLLFSLISACEGSVRRGSEPSHGAELSPIACEGEPLAGEDGYFETEEISKLSVVRPRPGSLISLPIQGGEIWFRWSAEAGADTYVVSFSGGQVLGTVINNLNVGSRTAVGVRVTPNTSGALYTYLPDGGSHQFNHDLKDDIGSGNIAVVAFASGVAIATEQVQFNVSVGKGTGKNVAIRRVVKSHPITLEPEDESTLFVEIHRESQVPKEAGLHRFVYQEADWEGGAVPLKSTDIFDAPGTDELYPLSRYVRVHSHDVRFKDGDFVSVYFHAPGRDAVFYDGFVGPDGLQP